MEEGEEGKGEEEDEARSLSWGERGRGGSEALVEGGGEHPEGDQDGEDWEVGAKGVPLVVAGVLFARARRSSAGQTELREGSCTHDLPAKDPTLP